MPELPEVETIARDLQQALPGRRIIEVEVRHGGIIAAPQSADFAQRLVGTVIKDVWRRGKYIIMGLEAQGGGRDGHLVFHLRMTGRLLLKKPADNPGRPDEAGASLLPEKHIHLIIRFQERQELHLRDTRRFGRVWLLDDTGLEKLLAPLGPEPLLADFTPQRLATALSGRSTKLKPFLLDQRNLVGLGNIYADEALFLAGLHPAREARSLSFQEVERLHEAIRQVLQQGLEHRGTTLSDAEYRDALGQRGSHQYHLAVFRRQGQPCPRCGTPIRRLRLAGRSTHYCPNCQPLPAATPLK